MGASSLAGGGSPGGSPDDDARHAKYPRPFHGSVQTPSAWRGPTGPRPPTPSLLDTDPGPSLGPGPGGFLVGTGYFFGWHRTHSDAAKAFLPLWQAPQALPAVMSAMVNFVAMALVLKSFGWHSLHEATRPGFMWAW